MPDKKYLIEIPGMPEGSGVWDSDKWERNKDAFMSDYPEANVFELGEYDADDTNENDQIMLTFENDPDSSGVWDAAKWERNKEAFTADHPEAKVNRVRYVDYWGKAAQENRVKREELSQPDAERDARLADLGYYDDMSGQQKDFSLENNTIGLKPVSSAIEQNSVSGETTYHDPKLAEFYANDSAHTERMAEIARLDAEYDSNPSVVAQREWEQKERAEQEKYIDDSLASIRADINTEVNALEAGKGAFYKTASSQGMGDTAIIQQAMEFMRGKDAGQAYVENEKLETYASAAKLFEKAKQAYDVAGKGFWGATADVGMDKLRDLATQSDIEAYNQIGDILTRLETRLGSLNEVTDKDIESNLSKEEQALIKGFFAYNEAMSNAQQDMSQAYKGGKIFGESISFMLEFLATGGLAGGTGKAAGNAVGKGLVKWAAKAAKGTAQRAARTVATKAARALTSAAVGTLARTVAAPGTYQRMAEDSVKIEDGHLNRGKNAFKAFTDSYIENLSEISGGVIGKSLKMAGVNPSKILGGMSFGKVGKMLADNSVMQAIAKGGKALFGENGVLKKFGFNGIFEEVEEEYIGNLIRELTIQPGALEEMHKDGNFGAMIIGFAPMTLFGAGMSAVSIGAKNIEAANLGKKLRENLSLHYTDQQIDHMMNLVSGAENADQVWEAIKPLTVGLSAEETQQLLQYGAFMAQNKAMLFAKKAQEDNLAQAKRAEAEHTYGKFWQENAEGAESVQLATLNDGRSVFVLSEPTADGVVSIIDAKTGEKGFTNVSNYKTQEVNGEVSPMTQKWSMDAYLEGSIAADRMTAEQARMTREYDEQVKNLQSQIQEGTQINLGTEGSPVILLATGKFVKDGVVAVDQTGNTHTVGWNQVADAMGQPIIVKTDQQIVDEEIAGIVARNAERRKKMSNATPAMTEAVNESAAQTSETVAQETKHIPLNEDGTVNEAAFWEQDPEGYAQWNDEQNQDGGADTIQQIEAAKAELTAMLNEAQRATLTSNPANRKAAKREVSRLAERLARLEALEQSYADRALAPLRERAKMWADLTGAQVHVLETEEELAAISSTAASENAKQGSRVRGFAKDGRAYIFLPGIKDIKEIDEVFFHEAVAHNGLKGLLGEEKYKELCQQVWNMMSQAARNQFIRYPGVNGDYLAAADEYIAHIAEKMGAGIAEAEEKTIWQKIVDFVRNVLREIGIELNVTEQELSDLLHQAYADLANNMAKAEQIATGEAMSAVEEASSEARQQYDALLEDLTPEEIEAVAQNDFNTAQEAYNAHLANAPKVEPGESSKAYIERKKAYNDELKRLEAELNAQQALMDEIADIKAKQTETEDEAIEPVEALAENNTRLGTVSESSENEEGVRFSVARTAEEWDDLMQKAIANRGYVFPNLASTLFPIVEIPYHTFEGENAKEVKRNAQNFAKSLQGPRKGVIDGREVELTFTPKAAGKLASNAAIDKSRAIGGYMGGHLAVVENIFKVLEGSRDVEIHPNILKRNKKREWKNGYDTSMLCHRYYSAVEVGGDQYLAMIMVMEHRPDGEEHQITPYSVEVQAIELTKIKLSDVPEGEIYNTTQWENASKSFTSGAKLLNGVKKSYDPGKFVLKESQKTRLSVITPQMDADYLAAVEAGDMETAQRMVLEAARLAMPNTKVVDENGNPKVVYHGSTAMFTIFDKSRIGSATGTADGRGFYFTTNRDYALGYKTPDGQLFEVFLNIEKPLSYDKKTITKAQLRKILKEADRVEYEQEGEHYMLSNYANYNDVGIDGAVNEGANLEYDYADNDVELVGSLIGGSGSFDLIMDAVKKVTGKSGMIAPKDNGTIHYVVTDPAGIKSAEPVTYDDNGNIVPLSERFNPENEDIRFSIANENQAIFVSNAARAVEGIKMEKATPEQWLKMIEKNGGLKAGEDKWMGLSDWLKSSDKKTLTKQEVLDFINENMIVIEEERYGEVELSALQDEFNEIYDSIIDNVGNEDESNLQLWEVVMNPMERAWEELRDRYSGGDDFDMAFSYDRHGNIEINDPDAAGYFLGVKPINDTRLDYTTSGLQNKQEIALVVPNIEPWNEEDDIHFGDAGEGRAVAWVRFGETEVPVQDAAYTRLQEIYDRLNELEMKVSSTGISHEEYEERSRLRKERDELQEIKPKTKRVLVIDEIQSKRHQEGREKGYRVSNIEQWLKDNNVEVVESGEFYEFIKNGEPDRRFSKGLMKYDIDKAKRLYVSSYNKSDIPEAPFEKNWHELAMKRMLRYAAENGYDVIAWTKGEQQADRYNLGKIYNEIEREDNPNIKGRTFSFSGGNYDKVTVNEDGVVVDSTIEEAKGKSLSDLVGKDLAVKMMSLENYDTIDGEDLRIGGEGMKGFYDKMLPAFMNKYGKKWGVKVEDIELPNLESGLTMHSVPVTEEMKASVMEGQVMFSVRTVNQTAQEFHNDALTDFRRQFNLIQPTAVVDINDRAALAEALGEELSDEKYQLILDGVNNGGRSFYDDDTKRIAIFALEEQRTSAEVSENIFHENTHAIISKNPELLELGQWLWDNAKPGAREKIKSAILEAGYPEWQDANEMLSRYTGAILAIGRAGEVLNMLPADQKKHWEFILKEFGYEPEREDGERIRRYDADSRRAGFFRKMSQQKMSDNGAAEKGTRFSSVGITPEVRDEMDRIAATAIFDGNYMLAPNGQPTKLTADQWAIVRTENFKRWFGDWINDPENASKVVDENGEPMVMYHGSRDYGFTVFNTDPKTQNLGSHFGTAEAAKEFDDKGENTYRVFLNIKKPWVPSYEDFWTNEDQVYAAAVADIANELAKAGNEEAARMYEEIVSEYPMAKDDDALAEWFSQDDRGDTYTGAETLHPKLRRLLEIGNYDGVKYNNWVEDPGNDSWVALNPSQIKSATDNTGEFSESEDIRFSANFANPMDSKGSTLTQSQRAFFGNSKAVDKDGNLLVLYHGTPRAGFTEFESGWFTTSKEDAISYSGDRKGRIFDPNEKYEPETLTAGDFPLGYMTFDSEEDRAAFLDRFPYAEEVMSERDYEDARMGAEDKEYDALTARRYQFAEVWNAYREYERERFVDTTVGDLIANPEAYTEEDLMRAMLEYDSNASFDSLDDMTSEERKDVLVSALINANEDAEGGISDMVVPTRVPRNGEGVKHNDLGNRTYEVYVNIKNPYEIDAKGRGSEFESGDVYKAVEDALADTQYDGVIIRNWRVGRTQQLGDVVVPKNGSQVKLTSNENPTESEDARFSAVTEAEEVEPRFSVVTDPALLERLESEPTIKVYRAMQLVDGKLYPPMSAKVDGKMREPIELGKWEQAEERPDLADEKGYFKLDKGNKTSLKARYNPYFHTSPTPLNDQFASAQTRPELVTVEVEVPESELTSGYKAEKAKDSVGKMEWKAGVVQSKLSGTRTVILSRWDKPVRIVPDSEVADVIVKMFEGKDITMPSNVVTPSLRAELEKRGVPFVETDNSGKPTKEDVRFSVVATPTDKVVAEGMQLSLQDFAQLAGNIFEAMPESFRKEAIEETFRNGMDMQSAIFQIPARLAEKTEWTDEDKNLARIIREKVQDAVDESGAVSDRPLTTKEALWMLYRSTAANGSDLISAARRSLVAHNLGFDPRSERIREMADDHIRYSVVRNNMIDSATDMYNYEASLWTSRLKESWLDMNQSVISLQNALAEASGKPIESWEDVVLALNQLSSKSYADKKKYMRDFLEPLWDVVLKITKATDYRIEDIERYMMLKHALERNLAFAKRDAREYYETAFRQSVAAIEGNESLSDADKQKQIDKAQKALDKHLTDIDAGTDAKFLEFREKDYGGLTSMFTDFDRNAVGKRSSYKSEESYQQAVIAATRPRYDNVADMEDAAKDEVDVMENDLAGLAAELWDKINAATKEVLRHQHASGMITTEQYNAVRNMFQHYVPLRGFADNTAEDMYSYYMNNSSNGFAMPIIGAKGRKTKAESPLGWIGTMAESAIQADNKNDAKIRLYYALLNRPNTGVLSIAETWYEYTGQNDANGRKIFAPVYPPATGKAMTADELRQHMDTWESSMMQKQAAGNAFKGNQSVNLRGSVVFQDTKEDKEHIIRVKVAGKDYSILVNGNPRAAQAINGLLNPDANVGPVGEWIGSLRRNMSALMTSFSPLFWVSNYQRDLLSSFMRTSESEGWKQAFKYLNNRRKAWRVASYIYKNDKGKLGNSYYENLYKEFAENGGITGYTSLTTNKEYEKLLEDYAQFADKPIRKWIKNAWNNFMGFGEAIEQVSRFAAFITAREAGKSIEEAVNAAKEVSVNFNRKGSAKPLSLDEIDKLKTKDGKPLNMAQKAVAIVLTAMPKGMKELYFFFNASIQALSSSAKLAKQSPGKATAWAGMYMGLSMALAAINYLISGDDDEEEYLDLPDYVRRSNALVKISDEYYLKWSLPQEMRPFYATADIILGKAAGNMPHKNVGKEVALAMAEWLPVNPFGTDDPLLSLVPDFAAPLAEIKANKNFVGGKIYDDMAFKSEGEKENIPAFRKATSKTGKVYVDVAEVLNAISGGDEVQKGAININPAVVEHLVEGYGGGLYDFAKMMVSFPAMLLSDEDLEVRDIPFVNKVIMSVDETNMYTHTNEVFYHYRDIAENAERVEKEYRNSDDPSRADAYRQEEDWRIHLLFEQYDAELKESKDKLKNAADKEEEDLLKQSQNAVRELLLNDIATGKEPDPVLALNDAIKEISKEISAIKKPFNDAEKKRKKAKDSGDMEGAQKAKKERDEIRKSDAYKTADKAGKDLKELRDLLDEIKSTSLPEDRDSLIAKFNDDYQALKKKLESK